jgi:plasmid maintenance system antidote protein VapI
LQEGRAEFWLNLQILYEMRLAEAKAGKAIKKLQRKRTSEIANAAERSEGRPRERRGAKGPPRVSA